MQECDFLFSIKNSYDLKKIATNLNFYKGTHASMANQYIFVEFMTFLACITAIGILQLFFSGNFLSFEIANLLREDIR